MGEFSSCRCPARHRRGGPSPHRPAGHSPDRRSSPALGLRRDGAADRSQALADRTRRHRSQVQHRDAAGPRRYGWPCPCRPPPRGRSGTTLRTASTGRSSPSIQQHRRRSWHAACGRPANTAPTLDAGAPRSRCRPTAQPRTAPGSRVPAMPVVARATAARPSAGRPAPPPRMQHRPRPPRPLDRCQPVRDQPSRHHGHVCQDGRRCRPRPDARIL